MSVRMLVQKKWAGPGMTISDVAGNVKTVPARAKLLQLPGHLLSHHARQEDRARRGVPHRRVYSPPDLPLSPLMDPEHLAAKEKYRTTKPPPSKKPNPFREQLEKNPYALALSTPTRFCQVTRTTLPRFFMQGFGLLQHPETKEPWMMPRGLAKYREKKVKAPDTRDGEKIAAGLEGEELQHEAGDIGMMDYGEPEHFVEGEEVEVRDWNFMAPSEKPVPDSHKAIASSEDQSPKIGGSTYCLARQNLIFSFNEKKTGFHDCWRQLMSIRLLQHATTRQIANSTNWRSDMDIFLLELMRRRTRESLEHLIEKKRGYLQTAATWESATMPKRQAGAILWTGPESAVDTLSPEDQIRIPEFAMLGSEAGLSRRIPVHNLRRLLGVEQLKILKDNSKVFESEWVILKSRRMTLDSLLKLWKLQGYLATHADHLEGGWMEKTKEEIKSAKRPQGPKEFWPWNKGNHRDFGSFINPSVMDMPPGE